MNIIIIGAGDIGFQLAKRLTAEKYNISLIETNNFLIQLAEDSLDALIIKGDGSNYETLKKAGIYNADILVSVTDNDHVNILSCMLAKKIGCQTTIARVRNTDYLDPDYALSRKDLGVDFFIQPEKETADAIVSLVKQANATDIVDFDDGKLKLLGIRLDKDASVLNSKLSDIGKQLGNPPITVVAIKRRQHTIIPRGDDLFLQGDQIFVVCSPEYLETALELLGKKNTVIKDILVIGGGLTATFVVKALEDEKNIKVIEKDTDKATLLADKLNHGLVINGDGSDLDLLIAENLEDMDEFIAITGDDETNIITSIVAKHLKVPRTITLIKKSDYLPLTPALGMDSVVSKQQITVNAIVRFIRRRRVAQYAELPGVDAEIIEFIITAKSKAKDRKISDLHIPRNSVIGAVLREDKMIVPKGDTLIKLHDKVIMFLLPIAAKDVKKIFM